MKVTTVTATDNDLSQPLLSPEPTPTLEASDNEESPEEERQHSPYWSFRTPGRRHHSFYEENSQEDDNGHPLPTAWSKGIAVIKIPLLIAAVLFIWPFGAMSFRRFTNSTDSTFHPISNSPSERAQNAFAKSYKDDWLDPMHPALLVVLQSSGNQSLVAETSLLYQPAQNFFLGLANHLVNDTCWKITGDTDCQKEPWLQVTSYFSLKQEKLSWLAKALTSPKGDMALLSVQYLLPSNVTNPRDRVFQLMDVIQDYGDQHEPVNCTVSYTGIKWFQSDLMKETQTDLRRMDAIVLPLALFLLGVVLPNARPGLVWIIPLIIMITTICSWSIVMRFVVQRIQITQFTPSIMMSVSLGMGIDYTLFLLSRYLEDTCDKPRAIRHMLQHGGHVLLLSGLTLICTFLGLCFLPLAMLKSVGIGAAVAIACALIVNLTIVPALLYTRLGDWIVQSRSTSNLEERFCERETSLWFRLSRHLLHPYKSVIILLVIIQLLLPVAFFATQLKSSLSFDLMLPKTSPSLQTFHALGDKLGYGRLSPYRILFDGREAGIMMDSDDGFDVMHRVLDELAAIDREGDGITHLSTGEEEFEDLKDTLMDSLGLSRRVQGLDKTEILCESELEPITTYAGIAVLKNIRIPHSLFVAAKYCAQMKPCPVEILHLIDYVDEAATSSDRYATFVTATLGINPFSDKGVQWLQSARDTVDRLSDGGALGGIQVNIEGSAGIEYDAVKAVYGAFPTVIVRTMLVVFLLMGIFFRSVVTPLRSVVSIGLTLSFVFGLGVLVYQHGILNWTRVPSWTSTGDEISWLVPVMAFSIIVGLALDYDVFLISRILEFRTDHAYDHPSSIAAGLDATGGIITAAGVIMAVAFGGLMFSSSPVLYQWSFLLTTAVLLDTFVIRTLVVPIVMNWTSKYSWWPRDLPQEHLVHLTQLDEYSQHPMGIENGDSSRRAMLSP